MNGPTPPDAAWSAAASATTVERTTTPATTGAGTPPADTGPANGTTDPGSPVATEADPPPPIDTRPGTCAVGPGATIPGTGPTTGTTHPGRPASATIDPGLIDPAIHAPARLAVMTALNVLAVGDALRFPALQQVTGLTGGNLTTHLRTLADAGYVTVTSSGRGRGSTTLVALTDDGRAAFRAYRAHLLHLLGDQP